MGDDAARRLLLMLLLLLRLVHAGATRDDVV